MMDVQHWIIGPQLIGIIFLVVGYIQHRWPPKTINGLYGYRTPASMKNQQTWDAATQYSAKFMMKAGAVLIPVGIVLTVTFGFINMDIDARMLIYAGCMVSSAMGTTILLMIYTEKHLEKLFDQP